MKEKRWPQGVIRFEGELIAYRLYEALLDEEIAGYCCHPIYRKTIHPVIGGETHFDPVPVGATWSNAIHVGIGTRYTNHLAESIRKVLKPERESVRK